MPDVTITLDACEPEMLFEVTTPDGIWLRRLPASYATGWPEISIRGPEDAVRKYVVEHWGDEYADDATWSDALAYEVRR